MPYMKGRTAQEIMDEAVKCGIVFELDARSENVTIKAAVNPPPCVPGSRRDREIANALKALLALAEYGVKVVPIWCPFPRITSMHTPLIAGDDCHQSLTFTPSTDGACPKDLYRLAHQNTRGICELLRRTWCTPRPPGYAVDTFLSYPSPLWLAAVAETDRTGQPPRLAQ